MRLIVVFLFLLSVAVSAKGARELPVLCYHQVAPGRMGDDMCISPTTFESHLQYLRKHGYHSVTLEEARLFLWGRQPLPKHSILLTFDDGYEGVHRYALPLLKQYQFRAVVFLVVGHIGDKKADTPHLDLKQLQEMKSSGIFEFGSHTYNLHVTIPERLAKRGIFPKQILADLTRSRLELQRLLGVDARALAWPYGHYNAECLQLAARAGFQMQFNTEYGESSFGSGTLRIQRLRVSANSNDVATLDWKLHHPEKEQLPSVER